MIFRKTKNFLALSLSVFAAGIGLFWLFFIMFDVLRHGISVVSPALFINDPTALGEEGGGLRNAFVGQLIITSLSVAIGVPLGILGGVFLSEYARGKKIAALISSLADILVSVPSIVIGTFAYALFVKPVGKFNGWAGSFALALILIPVVLRTTEDMLKLVPENLREAAFALGATRSQVVFQITFRAASSGILTGILLAIARVAGETAPLLFTSLNNNFFSMNPNEPMASLTVTIFQYAMGPYEVLHKQAWAASFVITLFILLLTVLGRLVIRRKHKL